jgi:hypothetical protein
MSTRINFICRIAYLLSVYGRHDKQSFKDRMCPLFTWPSCGYGRGVSRLPCGQVLQRQRALRVQSVPIWQFLKCCQSQLLHSMPCGTNSDSTPTGSIWTNGLYFLQCRLLRISDWHTSLWCLQPWNLSEPGNTIVLSPVRRRAIHESGRGLCVQRLHTGLHCGQHRHQPVHRLRNWKVREPGREPEVSVRRLHGRVVPVPDSSNILCDL